MTLWVKNAIGKREREDEQGRDAYYRQAPPPEGFPVMLRHAVFRSRAERRRASAHALSLVSLLAFGAGCNKTAASASSPDFAGEWDVTYDDAMSFELRVGGQVQRGELSEAGGQFTFGDAGAGREIDVDCTRPELLCPSEVWPREMSLTKAPGRVDDEGVQFSKAIAGQGGGRCESLPGSTVFGEVASVTKPDSVRQEAVALTSGHIVTFYDASCFAPLAGLPAGSQVILSTGFTAAKR